MRSPSGDSPAALGVLVTKAFVATWPITLLSIGATSALYLATSATEAGSCGTSRVTMWFSALVLSRITSPDLVLIVSVISVTMRPNDEALVTRRGLPAGSGIVQLYAW